MGMQRVGYAIRGHEFGIYIQLCAYIKIALHNKRLSP